MTLTPKLIVFIIMFPCSFALQRLISKKENPWIGLLLPFISFFLALFWGIGRLIAHRHMGLDVVLRDFLLFSSFNTATVIHLIIYFISRKIPPGNDEKETEDKSNIEENEEKETNPY